MKPIYWGIFTPWIGGTLDKIVMTQHITFGFKTEFPEGLCGKIAYVRVVGYGNDGQNEAYSVKLPDWTKRYYGGAKVPHITLSTSKLGKPVDSGSLSFSPVEPFILAGLFGYFDKEGVHRSL